MSDLLTRVEAQENLDYLREVLGDRCSKTCTHSVANTPAEHCLEARASGELMTHREFIDSLDLEAVAKTVHEQWMRRARAIMVSERELSVERIEKWQTYLVPYDDVPENIRQYVWVEAEQLLESALGKDTK